MYQQRKQLSKIEDFETEIEKSAAIMARLKCCSRRLSQQASGRTQPAGRSNPVRSASPLP